jgi:hypothetical protein
VAQAPVEQTAHVAPPPADDDFASRLDLGDDDPPQPSYDERGAGYGAPRYHAVQFRPHETGEEFDEPHQYAPAQYAPAHDLEQALSALDVDLDPSLSRHSRTAQPRSREPTGPAQAPGGRTRFRDPTGPPPPLTARTRFRDPTGPPPSPTGSAPRAREPSRSPASRPAVRPLPGLPVHRPVTDESPTVAKRRAQTDDGIMIDFDDED